MALEELLATFYGLHPLIKAGIVDVGIQWGLWCVAAYLKTEVFYDLAGSSTFLLLAWQSLGWGKMYHTRQVVQTLFVSAWSLRLGSYLFVRIINDKGVDKRFNRARDSPYLFFIYWTVQAAWIWVTLAPTMILNTKRQNPELSARDYIGWSLWLVGFILETVADTQKSSFKSNPNNHGKWIQTGLWKVSRHPNYLGEMLLWIGLFVSASSVLKGLEWISILSPGFVVFLLTRVSGIPLLERQAEKRWGQLAAYQDYKRNTACLIPFIW